MSKELFMYYIEQVFFYVGIIALIAVPVLALIAAWLFKKNKKVRSILCLIFILPFMLSFFIALPNYIALYLFDNNVEEHPLLWNFAVKTAVFPLELKSEIIYIPAFQAKMALNPYLYSSHNNSEQKDLIDKTLYYFNEACFLTKKTDGSACAYLAQTYAMLGKYDEAIYTSEYMRKVNLDMVRSWDLVQYYILNKDYEGALAVLKKSKFNKEYEAEVYRNIGKYDEALKILNACIEHNKHNSLAYRYRAYVYNDLGKTKLAKADYYKILEKTKPSGLYKDYETFIKNSDLEYVYDQIRQTEGFKPLGRHKIID